MKKTDERTKKNTPTASRQFEIRAIRFPFRRVAPLLRRSAPNEPMNEANSTSPMGEEEAVVHAAILPEHGYTSHHNAETNGLEGVQVFFEDKDRENGHPHVGKGNDWIKQRELAFAQGENKQQGIDPVERKSEQQRKIGYYPEQ